VGAGGKKLSDDVELRSLDPFYQIRFTTATTSLQRRPRQDARRGAPHQPFDAAGYERFMAEADHCYRLGFEALGAKAFDTVGDLIKASPAIFRMRGWRSLHAMVASHLKHPKLRTAMSLQSLLIGGNPFSVTCIYSLINALERQWGVHWAVGGTGQTGAGSVGLLQGRAARCAAAPRSSASRWTGAAPPASRWPVANALRPTSWSPTPTPPGPTGTWSSRSTAATGPTAASTRAAIR
jgi:phytoene desaturase